MLFLHCFLAWLTGHWWGSRFGATWRDRVEPGWANRFFISPWFLRCGLILAGLHGADILHLVASDVGAGLIGIVLLCLAAGVASGVALGREAY
jgi:hypothetical protein